MSPRKAQLPPLFRFASILSERSLLLAIAAAFPGCSVRDEISAEIAREDRLLVARAAEIRGDLRGPERRELSWKEAIARFEARNLNLARDRRRIADLIRERDEQWKEWLPRLNGFVNLQTSLAELGNLGSSNLGGAIIAPLFLPNPLTERARAFELALRTLQSQDNSKVNYRRQVVSLYQLFSTYEQLAAERARLESAAELTNSVSDALSNLESRSSWQQSIDDISQSLAELLQAPGSSFVPRPGTRPDIDYSDKIGSLTPGVNYGQLGTRLLAYQIEAALLQERGVKLSTYPFVTVSASSPAIVDSRRNDAFDFYREDQIFLFSSISESVDFANPDSRRIESAEENTAFVRAQLLQRLDREARNWQRIKERYRQIALKRALARERLERLREKSRSGSARADLEAFRTAYTNLQSLDRAKENLDLEVWIWDESRW